jgi:hypothetical protein
MSEDKKLKSDVEMIVHTGKILYPRSGHASGDFAIAEFSVVKVTKGELDPSFSAAPFDPAIRVVCKGKMPDLSSKGAAEKEYFIRGKFVDDPAHGPAYEIISMRLNYDMSDPEDIRTFLSFFTTEGRIEKLFSMYDHPEELLRDRDYAALMKIKGIKEATAIKLCDRYAECKDNGEAYIALSKYGLTKNAIDGLVGWYGSPDAAIEAIQQNPYSLLKVWGYGWERADAVARSQGFANDCEERIVAYANFFLESVTNEGFADSDLKECGAKAGDSRVPVSGFLTAVYSMCAPTSAEHVQQVILDHTMSDAEFEMAYIGIPPERRLFKNDAFKDFYYDEKTGYISQTRQRILEKEISRHIQRINEGTPCLQYKKDECLPFVKEAEEKQGFEYTDEQVNAIWMILSSPMSVLTGRAGCVSADTEFFDGKQWKRIDLYKKGDSVMQYNDDKTTSIVKPIEYIRLTCGEKLCHLHNEMGVDMMVSQEHTMVFQDPDGKLVRMPLKMFLGTTPVMRYQGQVCNFIRKDGTLLPFRFMGYDYNETLLKSEWVYPCDGAKYCFTVPSHMWVSRYHGCEIVTGNSGKSSVLNAVTKIVQHYQIDIEQCALSGRASSNLTDITGLTGKTIHRLLGYVPGSDRFAHTESRQLPVGMYVVDEAAMVGGELFLSLLQAIPTGSMLVLVGDVAQLDPIGGAAVFKDCISSRYVPVAELRELHRQAKMSGIVDQSLQISYGKSIVKSDFCGTEIRGELKDFKIVCENDKAFLFPDVLNEYKSLIASGVDPHDIQVLSPLRSRGSLCCATLNAALQKIANPKVIFDGLSYHYTDNKTEYDVVYHPGDRVIVTRNNYSALTAGGEKCAVFNGNIGYVKSIVDGKMTITLAEQGDVVYNAKDLSGIQLAYAATVHKFQGTGVPYVIFALDMSAYRLLSRELIYTALTRAKKYCCVVADPQAIVTGARISSVSHKSTWLLDDLRGLEVAQLKKKLGAK